MTPIRIGTRASRLAMAQAQAVADLLREYGFAPALVPLATIGDRDSRRALGSFPERGVFASEIETALRGGQIDIAVHSAKDLTGDEPDDLVIAACLRRADPRDAWCGAAHSLADVAHAARVGTASLRRGSQLRRLRPDLRIEPLRGNVDTRLRKLRERRLDGVVLAACGLDRLGLDGQAGFRFSLDDVIPESGQGIIAVQVRRADQAVAAPLDDPQSSLALRAERAVTRRLAGGCSVPVAAHAQPGQHGWCVRGYVGSVDGSVAITDSRVGPDPLDLAGLVATTLLEAGGDAILDAAR